MDFELLAFTKSHRPVFWLAINSGLSSRYYPSTRYVKREAEFLLAGSPGKIRTLFVESVRTTDKNPVSAGRIRAIPTWHALVLDSLAARNSS